MAKLAKAAGGQIPIFPTAYNLKTWICYLHREAFVWCEMANATVSGTCLTHVKVHDALQQTIDSLEINNYCSESYCWLSLLFIWEFKSMQHNIPVVRKQTCVSLCTWWVKRLWLQVWWELWDRKPGRLATNSPHSGLQLLSWQPRHLQQHGISVSYDITIPPIF